MNIFIERKPKYLQIFDIFLLLLQIFAWSHIILISQLVITWYTTCLTANLKGHTFSKNFMSYAFILLPEIPHNQIYLPDQFEKFVCIQLFMFDKIAQQNSFDSAPVYFPQVSEQSLHTLESFQSALLQHQKKSPKSKEGSLSLSLVL